MQSCMRDSKPTTMKIRFHMRYCQLCVCVVTTDSSIYMKKMYLFIHGPRAVLEERSRILPSFADSNSDDSSFIIYRTNWKNLQHLTNFSATTCLHT